MLSEAEKKRVLRVHERKMLLKQRGLFYRHFGDPSLVRKVIHEEQRNPRLRKEIAAKLRLAYNKVWPV